MEPLVATVITALISSVVGAIVGAVVSKLKLARKAAEDAKRESVELKELMVQNILMTCRMAIYDEHFTVDEKIEAYIVYRDTCHANHQTKKHMDGLVGCDIDEYIEKHKG